MAKQAKFTEQGTQLYVPHIGDDYGKVVLVYSDGDEVEYEVARPLAIFLQNIHGDEPA